MLQGASRTAQACHTMVCHPARGSHCTASAIWLAAGLRKGGQAWGRDLSGRQGGPCKRKGWAGGRTEGNWEVRSSAPATEAPWQGDGEREGLAGPFCHTNHSHQVRQSQITSPGFSGSWGPAEVTCLGRRTENLPTSHTRIASNSPMKVCELGTLLLAAHLISLGPRALLFIKLGPRCCWEACFPWLKLRKPQPGPFPMLLIKHASLPWPSTIKCRPFP